MVNKTLIFSIALNGYQWMYSKELASHKQYAKRNSYDYQAVTRPYFSALGVECCWLKLTLMRAALSAGYQNVMFIDADATVKECCPPLDTLFSKETFIYMAKGYSQRFNSGVLIAQKNPQVIDWLTQVINSRMQPVLDENRVGWGENGHIIELSKGINFIGEIDKKWNNTDDPHLSDFIQHKNCGPLRTSVIENFLHRLIFSLSYRVLTLINAISFLQKRIVPLNILEKETHKITLMYPRFLLPLAG